MRATTRSICFMVLLLAGGCGPRAGMERPLPEPTAATPLERAASGIVRACATVEAEPRGQCYEQRLLQLLEQQGVSEAMAVLDRLSAYDPEIRREGHTFAHAIGLAALERPEEVGTTFASCTPIYQSGCYHGVIQSYFAAHAQDHGDHIDAEAVNTLCADHRNGSEGRWLLFQCAHGMGHGLTLLNGQRLQPSLAGCDLVSNDWEREACYGGVFMELVVQATMPHHTIGRPRAGGGGDEHGAHAHGGDALPAGGAAAFALDPADRHYPCSALDDRYLVACYQMQTSAVLFLNGGDFAAAATFCDEAPERFRTTCYSSIGRDVSGYVVQDHQEAMRRCALGTAPARDYCHLGYVKNLIDLSADPADGMAYCRQLPAGSAKALCYRSVGEQIWALGGSDVRREELCGQSEAPYRQHCRTGAALMDASPAGRGAD